MNVKDFFAKFIAGMKESLKLWAIQLIVDAEKKLPGETGAEKRKYVVAQLDDMVKLPWYAEPFDAPVFGILVDLICGKLNLLTDKKLAEMTPETIKKAATLMDVEDNEIKSVSALSVDERIDALYKKYGIK